MGCASSQQHHRVGIHVDGQSQFRALDNVEKKTMDELHNSLAKLNTKSTTVPDWQTIDIQKLLQEAEHNEESGNSVEWWDVVDKLNSKTALKVKPETKRVVWKTIRLFVSSTFKDMNTEREHLVKQVFPQLRQWCEERKLRLIECDLRWGIPKGADTSETLIGCLSQIDRCREENDCPYFLSMLSERYGWCPSGADVPDHIKTRYKWIPGLSVTSMEIFTGAYWDKNPNALFMLRDASFVKDIANSECKSACTESNEMAVKSLTVLKDKLIERFPGQVSYYKPSVVDKSARDLQLSDLEQFGQTVLERLKSLIDRQYPADSLGETLSLSEIQRTEHENFMIQRSQVLLGRNEILGQIRDYVTGDNSKPAPLVLVGSPGAGKSAVIAYCCRELSTQDKCKTFYHFVGATPGSTDLYQLLTRLWTDLAPTGEQIPSELDEMVRSMDAMFVRAAAAVKKDGRHKLVVFIDALNQMDDEGGAHELNWLPGTLPKNMRVVVSTLDGRCREALRAKKSSPREIIVEPLNTDTRKQIANQIFSEFSKKLDAEQLGALVSKEDAGRPLWLSVACEELRIFGSFSKLLDKIKDLPGQLTDLLSEVLARIISTYGGDLVLATLCLIETSRFGLLETELVELLAANPVLPSSGAPNRWAEGDKLPMATWALIFVGLRQYLRPSGNSGEGRLDFYHRTISKVVRSEYLSDRQKILAWHARLADYFEKSSDVQRKAEELPYHLETIGDVERLKACLLDLPIFSVLYKESTKPQLMKYWLLIGGYEVAAQSYVRALKQYIQDNCLTDVDQIEPIQIRVAMFILDIGEYEVAEELLHQVKDNISRKYGSDSKRLSGPLRALVALKTQQANKFVYGRHLGYRDAMMKGRQLGQQCVEIYKKYWAPQDLELGRTLGFCGYFCRDGLPEARRILTAAGDLQNLAPVIYMMGKDNEHHKDMNVPIQLYEQAIKLCKSQFGKFHLKTARCYQLYGQMFWNRYVRVGLTSETTDWLKNCLALYKEELEILEELLGATHPTTVRSRADVVIILERLGRKQESEQLATKQPAQHDAL